MEETGSDIGSPAPHQESIYPENQEQRYPDDLADPRYPGDKRFPMNYPVRNSRTNPRNNKHPTPSQNLQKERPTTYRESHPVHLPPTSFASRDDDSDDSYDRQCEDPVQFTQKCVQLKSGEHTDQDSLSSLPEFWQHRKGKRHLRDDLGTSVSPSKGPTSFSAFRDQGTAFSPPRDPSSSRSSRSEHFLGSEASLPHVEQEPESSPTENSQEGVPVSSPGSSTFNEIPLELPVFPGRFQGYQNNMTPGGMGAPPGFFQQTPLMHGLETSWQRAPPGHIYICHLCSYSGATKEEFEVHLTVHFAFNCEFCDYKARTGGRLKRHIKDFHSSYNHSTVRTRHKKYTCRHCDFSATAQDDYWNHLHIHMSEDKMIECPLCSFVTEYKHHMTYHLCKHFEHKPYKCTKCNYSCINKAMLNTHMKSHSNVYKYRCADCNYATKYHHSLKTHLKKYSHTPNIVLNSDGSIPQGTDAEISGVGLLANRGPPRGPKVLREDKNMPGFFPIPSSSGAPLFPLPGAGFLHNWMSMMNPSDHPLSTDPMGGAMMPPSMPPSMEWAEGFQSSARPATQGSSEQLSPEIYPRRNTVGTSPSSSRTHSDMMDYYGPRLGARRLDMITESRYGEGENMHREPGSQEQDRRLLQDDPKEETDILRQMTLTHSPKSSSLSTAQQMSSLATTAARVKREDSQESEASALDLTTKIVSSPPQGESSPPQGESSPPPTTPPQQDLAQTSTSLTLKRPFNEDNSGEDNVCHAEDIQPRKRSRKVKPYKLEAICRKLQEKRQQQQQQLEQWGSMSPEHSNSREPQTADRQMTERAMANTQMVKPEMAINYQEEEKSQTNEFYRQLQNDIEFLNGYDPATANPPPATIQQPSSPIHSSPEKAKEAITNDPNLPPPNEKRSPSPLVLADSSDEAAINAEKGREEMIKVTCKQRNQSSRPTGRSAELALRLPSNPESGLGPVPKLNEEKYPVPGPKSSGACSSLSPPPPVSMNVSNNRMGSSSSGSGLPRHSLLQTAPSTSATGLPPQGSHSNTSLSRGVPPGRQLQVGNLGKATKLMQGSPETPYQERRSTFAQRQPQQSLGFCPPAGGSNMRMCPPMVPAVHPYECPVCQIAFKSRVMYELHMSLHKN